MRKALYLVASAAIALTSISSLLATVPVHAQEAAAAAPAIEAGRPIYTADNRRLGAIYRLAADGSPQVIVEGRMVTVPAASVSAANGRISTTLTKREVLASR